MESLEGIKPENIVIPTPEQIMKLARMVAIAYQSRDELRTNTRFPSRRFFLDTISERTEQTPDKLDTFVKSHYLSGALGRVTSGEEKFKLRIWSMTIVDAQYAHTDNGFINTKDMYRFRWDEEQTLLAERKLITSEATTKVPLWGSQDTNSFSVFYNGVQEALPVSSSELDDLSDVMQAYLFYDNDETIAQVG